MVTSTIGRMLLDAFNEREGTHYDAHTFFAQIFCPLFFDHHKYMMTAGNSPLENPKLSWADMIAGKKPWETPEQRKNRFDKLMAKIDAGVNDASVARGYPITDVEGTTSGQVTDMALPLSQDDVMLSWVGDALGVGVQGGYSILFFHKQILLDIFDGWQLYRQLLENTRLLKGNQINTWNGQWLVHYLDPQEYIPSAPMAGFNPYDLAASGGTMSLDTQSWSKVLIAITRKYSETQIMGYIYTIGQMNTTLGFIPFNLSQIRRPLQLYIKYFGMDNAKEAEDLWGTGLGFKRACQEGIIGMYAMKPKGLEKYMKQGGNMPKPAMNKEQQINYNVYKIWLLAMLNNDEFWDKSQELAQLLMEASVDEKKKISTKSSNLVQSVLTSTSKKQFAAAATELLANVPGTVASGLAGTLASAVKEVHFMPNDNVPYFLTLVRFQYAYLNKKQ